VESFCRPGDAAILRHSRKYAKVCGFQSQVLSDILKQDDSNQIKSFYKMSGVGESRSRGHLI
jgi:hypothetical protein